MSWLKTIVVGYDFSEGSKRSFGAAVELARQNEAGLVVVTAIPGAIGAETWSRILESHSEAGRVFGPVDAMEDVERLVSVSLSAFDIEGIDIKIDIVEADVSQAIARAAHTFEADLIVVGATGWSGSDVARLGSQTERLLRRSIWPVLVIRENISYPPEKVVLATDFSEAASATMRDLLNIVRASGSKLHVAHVVSGWSDSQRAIFRSLPLKQDPAAAQAAGLTELEDWLAKFDLDGVELSSEVAVGEAHTVLADIVREQGADLFAFGSLGASKWMGMLIGSNAERLIRSVSTSLFACKPDSFVFDMNRGTLLR